MDSSQLYYTGPLFFLLLPSQRSYAMPPKRHIFNAVESTADRWRRLCPDWAPPASLGISVAASDNSARGAVSQRGSKRPAPVTSSRASAPSTSTSATSTSYVTPPSGRADAPVVRHVRRGTMAEAVAALANFGSVALVESLLQDRYARSASSTVKTLVTTWEYFHDQAFWS